MDTEVIAKVEDDKRETGSCTEGMFVELGVVSKDTQGDWGGNHWEGGMTFYFA